MKSESSKRQEIFHGLHDGGRIRTLPRSAGFQTCRIADFQIGNATKLQKPLELFADLEIRDTADLEVGATEERCADAPS